MYIRAAYFFFGMNVAFFASTWLQFIHPVVLLCMTVPTGVASMWFLATARSYGED